MSSDPAVMRTRGDDSLVVYQVRATSSGAGSGLDALGAPITGAFDLGRMNSFVDAADRIAPRIAAECSRSDLEVAGKRWSGVVDRYQRLRIDVAGGGLVDVRILAVPYRGPRSTIHLLEDLYYESLDGEPPEWDLLHCDDPGPAITSVDPFHQVVVLPPSRPEPSWDLIQRLIYRADLDAVAEFSSIGRPDELNRRPGIGAAVGSFGSVLWGQQHYIEAGIVLSAALTVSATAGLQVTRTKALDALRDLHSLPAGDDGLYSTNEQRRQLRYQLVETHETISQLEAELTFGAEGSATINPILPSLRIEAYHQMLYDAADITRQAHLVDRMLGRLRGSAEAELSALQTVEAGQAQARNRRWSFATQLLAAVAIPLSLLLSYFGVSTSDVSDDTSLFDFETHWRIYAATTLLVAVALSMLMILRYRDARRLPQSRRSLNEAPPLP